MNTGEKKVKVLDLEASRLLESADGLDGYAQLQCLLRWHGEPIGYLKQPVCGNICASTELRRGIVEGHSTGLIHSMLREALRLPGPKDGWTVRKLFHLPWPEQNKPETTISVAVCTRHRTEQLARCLQALEKLAWPPLEILVIDNAPQTTSTRDLIARCFPQVRYVEEPRPGLDWARNRAIAEARGDIIAYTDDDVIVDELWTKAIARIFSDDPGVAAVTGLVVPYELETRAQLLFEDYGGFGRGFERKWTRGGDGLAREHGGAGKFGTGANMAFRRSIFSRIGLFDPALDVGTVTQGGGDLDMFFRVLKYGLTLVYDPAVIVRHQHRRDKAQLRWQIASNGIGLYSYFIRNMLAWPDERAGFIKLGWWWFKWWNLRRLAISLFKPSRVPRELIWAELKGVFQGLFRYNRAGKRAAEIERELGRPVPPAFPHNENSANPQAPSVSLRNIRMGVAVRKMNLAQGIRPLSDVTSYAITRVILTWNDSLLGQAVIENKFEPISSARLADEAVIQLGFKLLDPLESKEPGILWAKAVSDLESCLDVSAKTTPICDHNSKVRLSSTPSHHSATRRDIARSIAASIVVATCNRPDDLRNCLHSLTAQRVNTPIEIIVVDNNSNSGLTQSVLDEFPQVVAVREKRRGSSYARNAGFAVARGEILVCTDDDVTVPPDWLEKLLTPFARNDVMAVTGNVFPVELETAAQIQFEKYGGLGRGFERRKFDRDWFDSFRRKAVPTWQIGATANAAFRACALSDPDIGLMNETLGAGMPAGVGEDTYLFYKILKAGHTIVYEPGAYVWHRHRVSDKALRHQILAYSKGHVAYHLTTFLQDHDGRGLVQVLIELPRYHLRRTLQWLRGVREFSLGMVFLEAYGNALGPFALWQSLRRVKKEGRSQSLSNIEPPGEFPSHDALRNGEREGSKPALIKI